MQFTKMMLMGALVSGLVAGSASAESFEVEGFHYGGQTSAHVEFNFIDNGGEPDTVSVSITNTGSIDSVVSAFVFNLPSGVFLLSTTQSPYDPGDPNNGWEITAGDLSVSEEELWEVYSPSGIAPNGYSGFGVVAKSVNPLQTSTDTVSGDPFNGLAVGETASFEFYVLGASGLTTTDFLSETLSSSLDGYPDISFGVRFLGVGGELTQCADFGGFAIPSPAAFGSGLFMLAGLIARRRRAA